MKLTFAICAAFLLLLAACSNISGGHNEGLSGSATNAKLYIFSNGSVEYNGGNGTDLNPGGAFGLLVNTSITPGYQKQVLFYWNRTDANSTNWTDNVPWPIPGSVVNRTVTIIVQNSTLNTSSTPAFADLRVREVGPSGNTSIAFTSVFINATAENISFNVSSGLNNLFNSAYTYYLIWDGSNTTRTNITSLGGNTTNAPLNYSFGAFQNTTTWVSATVASNNSYNITFTSLPIYVGEGTEYSITYTCGGTMNVTNMQYFVGADNVTFLPGAVSLTPCRLNTTRVQVTETGVGYIKINGSMTNVSQSGTFKAVMVVK